MKYFAALLGLAVVVGLAACGSKVNLPPVSPEDVEVYLPGTLPTESFKVMSQFEEAFELNAPDTAVVNAAKEWAAEQGADAVLIDAIRRTTEGEVQYDITRPQEKIVIARSIYFPSRHPELADTN